MDPGDDGRIARRGEGEPVTPVSHPRIGRRLPEEHRRLLEIVPKSIESYPCTRGQRWSPRFAPGYPPGGRATALGRPRLFILEMSRTRGESVLRRSRDR